MKQQPLLVGLDGDVQYHIENIIAKIYDGTIQNYPRFIDRPSITNIAYRYKNKNEYSHFEYSIFEMIEYSVEKNGWYNAEFSSKHGISKIDILFFDEFVFLFNENLIKFDKVSFYNEQNEILTDVSFFVPKGKLREINNSVGIFD